MDSSDETDNMGLNLVSGFDVNVPAIRFVLKHWTKLRNYYGTNFWRRLFGTEPREHYWNALARFADEFPSVSRECLDFYMQQETKAAGSNAIQFIAKVRPGSRLLLDYCLTTLGLRESLELKAQASMPQGIHITVRDQTTAAKVLGQHFADDMELPRRLYDLYKDE